MADVKTGLCNGVGEKSHSDVDKDDTPNAGLLSCEKCDVTDPETADKVSIPVPFLCSQRWVLGYLGFYFAFVLHMLRVNMSLTLPYMVKDEGNVNSTSYRVMNTSLLAVDSNQSNPIECSGTLQSVHMNQDAEFSWSKLVQSMILASYFWGYILTQIIGGWVSGRYGGKRVVTVGMAISTLLTLLTPVLTRASPYALMACRFLIGICAGASFPALFNLIGSWSLPHERSRLLGMVFLGCGLGTIIGILSSGFLCDKGFDNGWGSVFYVHGIFSVFFVVLWIYCVADSPQQHPRIGKAEKELFERQQTGDHKKRRHTPWRKMLTYVPLWVICVTHSVQNFTLYLIFLCLPLFLKDVMHFDIQNNSLFSSLPFVTNMIGVCIAGVMADNLVSRKWLSMSNIRKLFQCAGLLGMAGMIVIPGYLDCSQSVPVIICISASTLFEAVGETAGYNCNIVDIAPRHASVIFGISNTFATIPGMIAPILVAELTPQGTVAEWQVVFYIAATCAVIGAVIFGLFSSSELAPWAIDRPLELIVTVDNNETELEKLTKDNDTAALSSPI